MKYFIDKCDSHELLRKILLSEYNISDYTLTYNEFGKPYLDNINLFFNLSNSYDVSALSVSNKEIGIDIEKITYNELIMKKCFNDVEKSLVINSCNVAEEFTRIWTVKEAYLKCIGTGIIDSLANVDTTGIEAVSFIYEDYYVSIVEIK